MSLRASTFRAVACSGDRYWVVPSTIPDSVCSANAVGAAFASADSIATVCVSLARPKSRTFT
jgi:hypothetical protein